MKPRTFVEKIFDSDSGSIVFRKPDIILSHDNTASIYKTFEKMGGNKLAYPDRMLVVLDHNAPPTTAAIASQYQAIRKLVRENGIDMFYDAGKGICHQIMSYHAKPGMLIVGSDSHTCTAGAFNALAAGIDRTETAGIWRRGETWFRVPDSLKITLKGSLKSGVYAKDISLWIIGMIGSAGANYLSIEFHGEGVKSLNISDRMTLANLASEMGAKNAVFPPDDVLADFYGKEKVKGVWADKEAHYIKEIEIELNEIYPLVAAPHQVDNVKSVSEVKGTKLNQGLIGTCTNGRYEDLEVAARILNGKKIKEDFQLLITPASKEIYMQAMDSGVLRILLDAGANVLSPSCGPCLGTGQGIPADGFTVISTANRNFKGRMGNKEAEIFLASPATVAHSALTGKITDPRGEVKNDKFPYIRLQETTLVISADDNRKINGVWNYADVNDLNTDQMFAGNLTYKIMSSDPETILPHLFAGFDEQFSRNLAKGDIIIAGENFGCGSSREHPSVGLAYAGVKAVIVKSVNRIFFRSAINQGLILIVQPDVVDDYKPGDKVDVNLEKGGIFLNNKEYQFTALPQKLKEIIQKKGLVNWIKDMT
ncbi:MAG: aconitase/3-isopropylmalate dehydratase large subunit family protein [Bacteroidota bacterium]|nr:aconitase/3-isopropylmalate dehydratase large subunit family protein [Bacteroidota bacterium]